jgi:hypothetical protein
VGHNCQNDIDRQSRIIKRENAQRTARIKATQRNPARIPPFAEQQGCNEEAADRKEQLDAEASGTQQVPLSLFAGSMRPNYSYDADAAEAV